MSAPWLERAGKQLDTLLASTTAPVVLHGQQAFGLFELAQERIAALLCEARVGQQACGTCHACAMRLAHHHPDCRVLLPDAVALGMGLERYIKSGTKPSQELRIDDVRELQGFFSTSSTRGQERYLLVYPFDALNLNTANALLKVLEEPPHGLRFVLVGQRIENLLPTIRSRCQLLDAALPSETERVKWLEGQGVSQADVALSLAAGDPFSALKLSRDEPDALALRKQWLEWLAQPQSLGSLPAGLDKLPLWVAMELAMLLNHDCASVNQGGKAMHFPWLAPKLLWAKQSNLLQLSRVYTAIQGEFRLAHHPINPRLALEFIAQQWHTLVK